MVNSVVSSSRADRAMRFCSNSAEKLWPPLSLMNRYKVDSGIPNRSETLYRVLLDMERHQMMLVYIAVVAGLAVLNYFMGKRLSKCINNIPKLIASCLMVIAVALVWQPLRRGLPAFDLEGWELRICRIKWKTERILR